MATSISRLMAGAFLIASLSATAFAQADGKESAEPKPEQQKPVRVPTGDGLVPHVKGFSFEPWYELDDRQLWQHIGWKVRLSRLPDSGEPFIKLMQEERFRDLALDTDWKVILSLGVDRLSELPNIEAVSLAGGIHVGPEQLLAITSLPRLRHLDVSTQPVFRNGWTSSSRLERLDVSYTAADLPVLRQVLGMGTDTETRRPFSETNRIQDLRLFGEQLISDEDLAAKPWLKNRVVWLSGLKQLRRLSVAPSGVADFNGLTLLPELRVLDLHDPHAPAKALPDGVLAVIARIPKLRVLRLDIPPTAGQLELLRPLTRLERIDIGGGQPTEEFRQALADTLPRVRTWVDMSGLDTQMMLNLRDTTLDGFIRLVAERSGVPIHVDAAAIERSGIDLKGEPLDQTLPHMVLRQALDGLLSDFGLIAIPHPRGLTVTARNTEAIWEQEHDLSPLLENLDTGDHHAARLAQILEQLTDHSLWGREAPSLAFADDDEKENVKTKIRSRGTQLVVTAGYDGQRAVKLVVDQLLDPEALLHGVDFRATFDRSRWYGRRRNDEEPKWYPMAINFADTPLVDAVEYLSRSFNKRITLDHEGITEAGIETNEPINIVEDTITLTDMLSRILEPHKLTWLRDGDDYVVTSQARAQKLTTVVVHQFDDNRLFGPPP